MKCKFCGKPADGRDQIDGVCIRCVASAGAALRESKPLTKQQLLELRAAIEQETAGLFPKSTLRALLEGCFKRVTDGEDAAAVAEDTASEIMRLGGLGMCREMLKVTDALGQLARDQEEEVRTKVRALSRMGR